MYVRIYDLLVQCRSDVAQRCIALLDAITHTSLRRASGSRSNHQAWPSGYLDHVAEVMNIAVQLHKTLSSLRPLPFKLEDALVVLFLHDVEKPWRGTAELHRHPSKEDRQRFREKKLAEFGIVLSSEQANALRYVEGEGDDYSPDRRVMNQLAAFCHMCDIASARLWPDHPLSEGADPWFGSTRMCW